MVVAVCCLGCSPSETADKRVAPAEPAPAGRTVGVTAAAVDSLVRLGDSLYRQSPEGARVIWQDALRLARSASDSVGIARALTGIGMAARQLGDYPTSRRLGEEALAIKTRLGMRHELARSYNALGLLAWDEERLADALTLFARVTEVAGITGDSASLARAETNRGLVLDNLGSFAAARSAFEKGRDIARLAGDSVNLGRALTNLASLEIKLGDPESAMRRLEAARALFQASRDSIGEVNAIAQLATAYEAIGVFPAAFAAFDTAQRMAARLGLRKEEAENLKLMGDLFAEAGDHRHALDHYARALPIVDSLELPEERADILRDEARSHAGLGNGLLAMQRGMEALRVHREGGFRYPELGDRLLLAELAQQLGRSAEAQEHLQAARVLAHELEADVVNARLALVEARVAAGAGRQRETLLLGSAATADATALRARAYERLGRLDAAIASGREAIAAVERIRGSYHSDELRTSYASRKAEIYSDQVLRLLARGRVTEAFQVADAARGRALLEHLVAARSDLGRDDVTRETLEREELLRRIDAIVAQLRDRDPGSARERTTSHVARTRELSDSLIAARNAYEALLARSPNRGTSSRRSLLEAGVAAGEVQAKLERDEALIEYFVAPDRLLMFVITRSGLTTVVVPEGARELAARVRLARELVQQPVTDDVTRGVLVALHGIVLAPVEASGALRGIRRLVVVPHAVLTYLPFAALVDSRSGRYAVETYSIMHATTASALVAVRSRPAGGRDRRATLAGAVFAPFPDRLPATREESQHFRRTVRQSSAYVGASSTEAALRSSLESDAIVHVATHGIMNARNPLFSRIEMSGELGGPPSNDGRLEVHELLGLRISSSLVFLSGCETGLGTAWSTPFDVGEDFATIGQAFLYAGAGTVVATLWRIADAGGAQLAQRFYEAHRSLPAPEALARAQRAMIADPRLRNPYLWAAYQVTGGAAEPASAAKGAGESD